MSAAAILARARQAGLELFLSGTGVRVRGLVEIPGLVDPVVGPATELRQHREEIRALLEAEELACLTEVEPPRCCDRCGSPQAPLEIGGFGMGTWRCNRCLAKAGMLP